MEKKDPTREQIKKWKEQIKEKRRELFAGLKFDKFGRILKEKIL